MALHSYGVNCNLSWNRGESSVNLVGGKKHVCFFPFYFEEESYYCLYKKGCHTKEFTENNGALRLTTKIFGHTTKRGIECHEPYP